MTGMQEHVSLEGARKKRRIEEQRVEALKGQATGYEDLLYIHAPLMNKGHSVEEIKSFVEECIQVVDRLGNLPDAREALKSILNIEELKAQERRHEQIIQGMLESRNEAEVKLEKVLWRMDSSAGLVVRKIEDLYDDSIRDRTLEMEDWLFSS
jgi:hypothetical protein